MDASDGLTEQAIDDYLGIGRKAYGLGWWALDLWTSGSSLNVVARAQNWGFHVPFGADFKDVSTAYGVAAYGVFGGGTLLWIVLAGLILHGATWGQLADYWPGRVPAAWESIADRSRGPIPWLLQMLVVLLAVVVPLYLQASFVSKFLAGRSVSGLDAKVGLGHLLLPAQPALSYVYDNQPSSSYCEFYEPWLAVLVATISFTLGNSALAQLLWPRSAFAYAIAHIFRLGQRQRKESPLRKTELG